MEDLACPLRIELPDGVYHVLNRGTACLHVFREPDDEENLN